jgi:hypothetical protein
MGMRLLMMNKIFKNMIAAFLLSFVLLILSLIIWFFMKESETSLKNILFWVGAVPIGLFSIVIIGDFSIRGDLSYQLSRSVSNQSSNQRALLDVNDIKSKVKSGLNWIIAGLIIWLLGYFI